MRFLKIVLLFFLFQNCALINAQDFIIGLKLGIGKGTFKQIENSQKTATTKILDYGLSLAYSPYYSKFSIESSVEYEKNDSGSYVFIPLGFRITFGKKWRPFVEAGGYYSFLTNSNANSFLMKNDYGVRLGLGLAYAVNKRWRIEAGYYKRIGFGGPLVENKPLPGNSFTSVKNKLSSYNVEVAFKYRF
jgi:opacity protein-like surface antigen